MHERGQLTWGAPRAHSAGGGAEASPVLAGKPNDTGVSPERRLQGCSPPSLLRTQRLVLSLGSQSSSHQPLLCLVALKHVDILALLL